MASTCPEPSVSDCDGSWRILLGLRVPGHGNCSREDNRSLSTPLLATGISRGWPCDPSPTRVILWDFFQLKTKRIRAFSLCEPEAASGPASCLLSKPDGRDKANKQREVEIRSEEKPDGLRLWGPWSCSCPCLSQASYVGTTGHPPTTPFSCKSWFEFQFCYLHPKESGLVCIALGNWGGAKLGCL